MVKHKQLTEKQVFEKLSEGWNFEKILEPYKQGGTESHPVERTWGLIISWLRDKKKYPLDIIGAAMLLTVDKIQREGDFKGTDRHGSVGEQLDHNLLMTCDMLQKQKLVDYTYKAIAESRAPHMQLFITRQVFHLLPWWTKMWSWKYWRYRKANKKHGA